MNTLIGTKEQVHLPKLIYKLPMTNKVIGEDYTVWDYQIVNKKTIYRYLYSTCKL